MDFRSTQLWRYVMRPDTQRISRIMNHAVLPQLGKVVLVALASMLVLAVTACASSEPEPAAPAAPELPAAAAPAMKAAPGGGEAVMLPKAPAPAESARAAVQDPSQAVKVSKVAQTKTIIEREVAMSAIVGSASGFWDSVQGGTATGCESGCSGGAGLRSGSVGVTAGVDLTDNS